GSVAILQRVRLEQPFRWFAMRIAGLIVGAVLLVTTALVASPGTSPPTSAATLSVHVKLAFDSTITSSTIKRIARDEAAATWKVYGVDLVWADADACSILTLDVFVERHAQRVGVAGTPPVLGYTTIASVPDGATSIHLSFDAIELLIERRHGADPLRRQL